MFSFSSQAKTRLTLQKRSLSDDGYGGSSESWSDLDTVWAVLDMSGGNRSMLSGLLPESKQGAVALIRYRTDIETSDPEAYRVQLDGRTASVESITALASNRRTYGRNYLRLRLVLDAPSRGNG